jgi:hypothetical protein
MRNESPGLDLCRSTVADISENGRIEQDSENGVLQGLIDCLMRNTRLGSFIEPSRRKRESQSREKGRKGLALTLQASLQNVERVDYESGSYTSAEAGRSLDDRRSEGGARSFAVDGRHDSRHFIGESIRVFMLVVHSLSRKQTESMPCCETKNEPGRDDFDDGGKGRNSLGTAIPRLHPQSPAFPHLSATVHVFPFSARNRLSSPFTGGPDAPDGRGLGHVPWRPEAAIIIARTSKSGRARSL